jgi:predicted transposase/invertase (TIGR01784 family)
MSRPNALSPTGVFLLCSRIKKIMNSKRLDEHFNAIQELQHLREFIHRKETSETFGNIASSQCFVSLLDVGCKRRHFSRNDKATKFLHDMVAHSADMKKAFPKAQYDGTMDFACELDDENYVLVEMQVLPKDNWDKWALAYVAAFYGNQLRRGSQWNDIKKVIGINILGGGTREQVFWKDSHDQHVRHCKFQEQVHKQSCEMFSEGIELFQYSVMNAPDAYPSSEKAKQDWITFFKRGFRMTEEEVKSEIHTEAVLKAFEKATLSKLPRSVEHHYDAENLLYSQVSQHTAERVAEGETRGRADALLEIALSL